MLEDKLTEVVESGKKPGWDGYDAEPIDNKSAQEAARLIELLPDNLQKPTITGEPDGKIALEWNIGNQVMLSMSFDLGSIYYAGLLGMNTAHGERKFFSEIPDDIYKILSKYFLLAR